MGAFVNLLALRVCPPSWHRRTPARAMGAAESSARSDYYEHWLCARKGPTLEGTVGDGGDMPSCSPRFDCGDDCSTPKRGNRSHCVPWAEVEVEPGPPTGSRATLGSMSCARKGVPANVLNLDTLLDREHGKVTLHKMSKKEVQRFRTELNVATQRVFDQEMATDHGLPLTCAQKALLAKLIDVDYLLPEISFDLPEAQAILRGEKRETARTVRECHMLLSAKERERLQAVSLEDIDSRVTLAEASELAAQSAAQSARIAASLAGCCVRANLFRASQSASNNVSPALAAKARTFALLQVVSVDRISESFTVLDFRVLHVYGSATKTHALAAPTADDERGILW